MHESLLYLGTELGVRTYRYADGEVGRVGQGVEGDAVRAIAIDPSDPERAYVGCGLRGWGLYRTTDGGRHFEPLGFDDVWVWDATLHPSDSETLFVGTEPPALHVSRDGGDSFERFDGLDALPSRSEWTFFHEPFTAGHVHGVALHEARPERILAGIEHGALVATYDGGETWHEALVGHDLHRVEVDPRNPDRVLAGAGAGLFESEDGGRTWSAVPALRGRYVHGIEFDPHAPGRIYVYVDSESSPVFRSVDDGESWTAVGDELPSARPADPLVVHPSSPDTVLYAGDDGEDRSTLFESTDAGETWRVLAERLPKVWRLEVAGE